MVVLTKVFLTTILGLERCWSKASGEYTLMVGRIYCNTPEQESFTRPSVAFVEEGGTCGSRPAKLASVKSLVGHTTKESNSGHAGPLRDWV